MAASSGKTAGALLLHKLFRVSKFDLATCEVVFGARSFCNGTRAGLISGDVTYSKATVTKKVRASVVYIQLFSKVWTFSIIDRNNGLRLQ